VVLLVSAALLSGCGGAGRARRPAVCRVKAQDAVARRLGVKAGSVTFASSVGDNDMPQCGFATRVGGMRITALVNVDDGAQAYFRLMRTVVEDSQSFVGARVVNPPQQVAGLGPYASWLPGPDELMATNGILLVTVTVTWPRARTGSQVALAKAAILPYLAGPSRLPK
jgi:hypothetical protein